MIFWDVDDKIRQEKGDNFGPFGPETAPTKTPFSNEYWRLTWQWCPVRFPFGLKPICLWIFLWSVWHVCLKHTCLCISFCCEIHGLEKPAWDCCSVCAHMWLRREFGELAAFTSASVYFEVCLSLDWWLKHFFGSEGLFGTEPQNRTFFLQSQISK